MFKRLKSQIRRVSTTKPEKPKEQTDMSTKPPTREKNTTKPKNKARTQKRKDANLRLPRKTNDQLERLKNDLHHTSKAKTLVFLIDFHAKNRRAVSENHKWKSLFNETLDLLTASERRQMINKQKRLMER